ncbi:MAG: PEGA domain-containing protein [Sandaracinaceae bacterium]|nr:PEGA domain-containing protein [Sandaracinaceae bacterium]
MTRTHVFALVCTFLAGCAHGSGSTRGVLPQTGVAAIVLEVEPDDAAYAMEVARALRRSPSPTGAPWLAAPQQVEVPLAAELARVEALFFDLDLEGAERAAQEVLTGMDNGIVPVEDEELLLRTLIRAAQVFDARNAGDDADAALTRANAVHPDFELSAADFPPSLIERRARLVTSGERHTLQLGSAAPGARIYVDGSATRARHVQLAPGRHVIRVVAPGHRPWQQARDLSAEASVEPQLEVDPERLHELSPEDAQRFLTLHDAHALRLQVSSSTEGRSCRLFIPREPSVSVRAPVDEEPAALAARLSTEREAAQVALAEEHSRRRRRRIIVSGALVAAAGAGTGAYFGLRPGADGWRANGQLEGAP